MARQNGLESDISAPQDDVRGKFLVEQELADRWRKSPRTIQRMRKDRRGPAFLRIGGSILYRLSDVIIYENTVRENGDPE